MPHILFIQTTDKLHWQYSHSNLLSATYLVHPDNRQTPLTIFPQQPFKCHISCSSRQQTNSTDNIPTVTPSLLRPTIYFIAKYRQLRFYACGHRMFYLIYVLNHRMHTTRVQAFCSRWLLPPFQVQCASKKSPLLMDARYKSLKALFLLNAALKPCLTFKQKYLHWKEYTM